MTYVFDEGTLVLECVSLAEVVELVVQVLVDLAAGTVLYEQTAEDSQTTHPQDLAGRTENVSLGIQRTSSLFISKKSELTLAFSHPWYPFSFRTPDAGRCGATRPARGRATASAW